jgi:hypothetical protein
MFIPVTLNEQKNRSPSDNDQEAGSLRCVLVMLMETVFTKT